MVALVFLLSGCAGFRAAHLYRDGTRALDAGESDRAVDTLREAARLAPQASEIQNHLGLALAATGHPVEALAAFERALDLDCSNAAAARNLVATRNQVISLLDELPSEVEINAVRIDGEP